MLYNPHIPWRQRGIESFGVWVDRENGAPFSSDFRRALVASLSADVHGRLDDRAIYGMADNRYMIRQHVAIEPPTRLRGVETKSPSSYRSDDCARLYSVAVGVPLVVTNVALSRMVAVEPGSALSGTLR